MMSFMRSCIVATAVLVVGAASCAPRDPVNIDFVGSDSEFEAAQRAASEWNDTCHRDLIRVYRGSGEGVYTWMQIGKGGKLTGTKVGNTHCEIVGAESIVVQSDSGYPIMAIFAHEFGHAILTCSDDDHTEHGVMGPVSLESETIDGHLQPGAISKNQCDNALK